MLYSICQEIWKTQQWPQDWKRSVFIPISKKGNTKECSNYHTIALILHASKVMVKLLQATFQQYVNRELPDVQAGFRKFTKIGGSKVTASAWNEGDPGSIPGLGRSPGEGKVYPLLYSGLENSMDCIVHGVAKSQTGLSDHNKLENS